jgi:hypothetical protein
MSRKFGKRRGMYAKLLASEGRLAEGVYGSAKGHDVIGHAFKVFRDKPMKTLDKAKKKARSSDPWSGLR